MIKIKKYVSYIIIAVVCATAFLAHSLVSADSKEVVKAREVHQKSKALRNQHLDELRKLNLKARNNEITKDSYWDQKDVVIDNYEFHRSETDNAWAVLTKAKENQKVFGFYSLKYFLGEIWSIGLLVYCLFTLYTRLYFKNNGWKGAVIIDSILIYFGLYYSVYLFIPSQDFTPLTYHTSLAIATVTLYIGIKKFALEMSSEKSKLKAYIKRLIEELMLLKEKDLKKEIKLLKEYIKDWSFF